MQASNGGDDNFATASLSGNYRELTNYVGDRVMEGVTNVRAG